MRYMSIGVFPKEKWYLLNKIKIMAISEKVHLLV